MTEPEMACCKKMAGKCDMGSGPHSCCDQTVRSQQVGQANLTQTFQLQPPMQAAGTLTISLVVPTSAAYNDVVANDGSPPESPPGSISVLRI
ncbi:MAG: hypothetical protein ACJ71N_09350 [Terriglobales bacterium]